MQGTRHIFITGGTSGLGFALTKRYLELGDRVGITGRKKSRFEDLLLKNPNLQSYVSEHRLLFFEVDVREEKAMKEAIDSFSGQGMDIIIANAGLSYEDKRQIPEHKITKNIIETNLLGTIHTFFPAIEMFREQKSGHLVAISSIAGMNGLPGVAGYSASKGGIRYFCESLEFGLRDQNTFVTCVCPGFIDTPLARKNPHPMPFMMDVETAARKTIQAIEKKKSLVFFPFIFTFAVRLLSILPRGIYRRIMSRDKFNYSTAYSKEIG